MRDDLVFFVLCAMRIPPSAHDWLMKNYLQTWVGVLDEVPGDHRAQNAARRSANAWLVDILKRKGIPLPTGEELKSIKF